VKLRLIALGICN